MLMMVLIFYIYRSDDITSANTTEKIDMISPFAKLGINNTVYVAISN